MVDFAFVDILLNHFDARPAAEKVAGPAKTSLAIACRGHFQPFCIESIADTATGAQVNAYLHFIAHTNFPPLRFYSPPVLPATPRRWRFVPNGLHRAHRQHSRQQKFRRCPRLPR